MYMTVALINLIILVVMFREEIERESKIKVILIALVGMILAIWAGV